MVRGLVAVGLLMTLLLAGCAGNSPASAVPDAPAAFDDVVVTDTTGAIRGVVVSESIVPIEGALVVLSGGVNKTTDADGAFVFNGLEAGDYFLTVSKLGYFTVQSSATVVAGQAEPPVTKVTLLANAQLQPFSSIQQWDGFVQCAFMAGNGFVGAQACGELDDRFIYFFSMSGIPDYAQAEMVWQSTQPVGNALDLSFYDGGTWYFKSTNGVNPLMINATKAEIVEWWGENETSLPMRVFPASSEPISVVYNQQFTVYMTMFYNFVPRQGWLFTVDGPCPTPEFCS